MTLYPDLGRISCLALALCVAGGIGCDRESPRGSSLPSVATGSTPAGLQPQWEEAERMENAADLVVRMQGWGEHTRFEILRVAGNTWTNAERMSWADFEMLARSTPKSNGRLMLAIPAVGFDTRGVVAILPALRAMGFSDIRVEAERWGRRTLVPDDIVTRPKP